AYFLATKNPALLFSTLFALFYTGNINKTALSRKPVPSIDRRRSELGIFSRDPGSQPLFRRKAHWFPPCHEAMLFVVRFRVALSDQFWRKTTDRREGAHCDKRFPSRHCPRVLLRRLLYSTAPQRRTVEVPDEDD